MSEDDWVGVAMADDMLVVQLLLNLNQAEPPPPPPPPLPLQLNKVSKTKTPALQLEWTVRQRRSKQLLPRKKAEATRASPATPLSWSGGTGTSVSDSAADGFEESSLLAKPIGTARSKVVVASGTTTTRRSRKKKTLPELKEEEKLLLKERRNLKNQLATLRFSLEKQRAANENLKRLKLELLSRQTPQIVTSVVKIDKVNSNQPEQIKGTCDNHTCSIMPISAVCNKLEPSSPNASVQKQEVGGRELSFMLPDLNLPVEDNSGSDVLCGIS